MLEMNDSNHAINGFTSYKTCDMLGLRTLVRNVLHKPNLEHLQPSPYASTMDVLNKRDVQEAQKVSIRHPLHLHKPTNLKVNQKGVYYGRRKMYSMLFHKIKCVFT